MCAQILVCVLAEKLISVFDLQQLGARPCWLYEGNRIVLSFIEFVTVNSILDWSDNLAAILFPVEFTFTSMFLSIVFNLLASLAHFAILNVFTLFRKLLIL